MIAGYTSIISDKFEGEEDFGKPNLIIWNKNTHTQTIPHNHSQHILNYFNYSYLSRITDQVWLLLTHSLST